ncbi:hypothetical protein LX64_02857 [Chitinophaga skermanii]|uniref:DUF748 domain-containing protein n=1 Tax=Chitinophaga skermanii TaxID=331697 RepID=A0A327QHU3_9BACT|nr:hypothetical protein [Chitinophaga skermanii]RAJ03980.1 hypothetical protein LX64_02857 [Chitinophaga skermanii]
MKKFWKILLISLGVLVLIVLCTGWYLNTHWKKLLTKELKHYVLEGTDSLYTLQYSDINLNVLTGNVAIHNVHLEPDSSIYTQLLAHHKAPGLLVHLDMERLEVNHLLVWKYFMKKQAHALAFALVKPKVAVIRNDLAIDTSKHGSFYEGAKDYIRSIYIDQLLSNNIDLTYTHIREDSSKTHIKISDLSLLVKDLFVDSVTQSDPQRYLYASNFDINLAQYDYRLADSLYWIHIKDISYHAAQKNLSLGLVQFDPRYNRQQFDKKIGTQKDRFDVKFSDVNFYRMKLENILQGELVSELCTIGGGDLDIYRNRSLPLPPGNKYGSFPNQLLDKLQLPVRIDTLKAGKVDLAYTELNPKNGEKGTIQFKQINATITNITNNDTMVKKNNHCVANLNAIFMQTGKLRAKFDFTLGSPKGAFTVSGQLSNMNGKELNPVTRPLSMVAVESLHISDLDFTITGNERSATSKVKFLYEKLRISILKDDGEKLKRKGLMSMIANLMGIYKENPEPGKAVRLATGSFQRDPQKSFFNLVWKTLFVGVMNTVGTDLLKDKVAEK